MPVLNIALNIPAAVAPDAAAAIKRHGDFREWCANRTPPIDPNTATFAQVEAYFGDEIRDYLRNLIRALRRDQASAAVVEPVIT